MTWIIGLGTFTNMRNIKKIKENIKVLQDQNILHHFLNLTMNQVREHRKILYDIDNRLVYINKTLTTHINASKLTLTYHEIIAVEVTIVLARLNNGIIGLQKM